MNEKTQQENVIPLSRAKSFSNSSAKAFSTMSAMQKVFKRGDSRTIEPGQRGKHPRSGELRSSLSQMSLMDNHPSKAGSRRGVAEAKLVENILEDIGKIRDIYGRHKQTNIVLAIETVMDLIREEYSD